MEQRFVPDEDMWRLKLLKLRSSGTVGFPRMHEILEPRKGKEFEVVHYELTREEIELSQLRDFLNFRREHSRQRPGTIVQLKDKYGEIMMSDTEMERRTNIHFLWEAKGDVLIGGLGLGMTLLAVQAKEEVNSITVIEIHQEIIDLVVPQLPLNGKVSVICGDIFEWYPPQGVKYDTIYFDVWSDVCGDNYEDMKKLHRRFARRLNRENLNCWMSCWRYNDVKRLHFGERGV